MDKRKHLVRTRHLAGTLNVEPAIIYDLVKRQMIPYYRVGGQYRFDEEEVLAILKDTASVLYKRPEQEKSYPANEKESKLI